jgi:hypothetical protein
VNKVERLYCDVHLFDLHQRVYVVNTDTGLKKEVAICTFEDLPEIINGVGINKKIYKVILSGNRAANEELAENITQFAKNYYNEKIMEVEVI